MNVTGLLKTFSARRTGQKRGEIGALQIKRQDDASEAEKAAEAAANSMKYLAMERAEDLKREQLAIEAARADTDRIRAQAAQQAAAAQVERAKRTGTPQARPRAEGEAWIFRRTQELIQQGMKPDAAADQANAEAGKRKAVSPVFSMPPSPTR